MAGGTGADSGKAARELAAVPAGGTKQLILETAQRLFDEQGYDATSLRQIAEAVGMTKAAVYYHYPAKEHLLLELTRPLLDAMSDMVARLRSDGEAGDARAALASYLDLFVDHLPVVHLIASEPATMNHPDVVTDTAAPQRRHSRGVARRDIPRMCAALERKRASRRGRCGHGLQQCACIFGLEVDEQTFGQPGGRLRRVEAGVGQC